MIESMRAIDVLYRYSTGIGITFTLTTNPLLYSLKYPLTIEVTWHNYGLVAPRTCARNKVISHVRLLSSVYIYCKYYWPFCDHTL